MKGNPEIIEALNEVLTAELTGINQYYMHSKMCKNWGYMKLAEKLRAESIEEMKHADQLIERILFLGGIPNMQRLNPVRVGENVHEQHKVDLTLEMEAAQRLNRAIELCRSKGDNGTRDMLEDMLGSEEDSIDWIEAQLHLIGEVGIQQYLAEQI